MSSLESKTTDNHEIIQNWVEERSGQPALADGIIDKGKAGRMLRINFSSNTKEGLNDISWELFFEIFDENNLAFLYQEENIDGDQAKFYKIINKL